MASIYEFLEEQRILPLQIPNNLPITSVTEIPAIAKEMFLQDFLEDETKKGNISWQTISSRGFAYYYAEYRGVRLYYYIDSRRLIYKVDDNGEVSAISPRLELFAAIENYLGPRRYVVLLEDPDMRSSVVDDVLKKFGIEAAL